ncbi:RNA recognition motif domain [Trinorchestia longiramus]|nr:RNA recognition motif domain [Trinorchestia longiramus]
MSEGCDKRRLLDDEMSRFEAEILGSPPRSADDSSEGQKKSVEDKSDDRPPPSSKTSVEAAPPLPPPPRPPTLDRSPAPLRPPPPPPPPPPPSVGGGTPHQHGPSFRPQDQMSSGPRPSFNGHRQFGPGPMGPSRPHGPHHRLFHPNGGPESYGPNGPRPYGPSSPQQYSNGPGPYRHMRPDGPYGPQRPHDFNMQGDRGGFMSRDHSGGPMRGPGSHRGPPIGPPPPTFLPPQLLRPPTMRPPPPPPPVHLMRNPHSSSTTASSTTASMLPTVPPPSAPRIVYASQPTLFTEIVKPAEPTPVLPPSTSAGDTSKSKDAPSNKESGRKNKKQKTSNGSNLVQQVTTTVSIVKKSSAAAKLPTSEPPTLNPPVQQPPQGPRLKKERRPKKNLRYAGGAVWEDATLNEWDPDDYRMFAGDLGNDVTDELLTRTFNCYPTFVKAKVVRDKFTNKSKGYGFLSFREPDDYTRAMKEMNGRYVGSRPIKLRKSQWRDRNLDVIQKKNAEKQLLGLK